ncbi:hypothetical protein Hanom_Chr16g01497921 [Helianthus anomalus]
MRIAGKWSLFDFVDPPRHIALRAANCVLGDQEPDVLKVHLEQFCYPIEGGSVAVPERKPTRIKVTGRKYMAAGTATSSIGGTTSAKGDTPAATELTSPTHVAKKRKTFIAPTLTAFEAVQAAYTLPLGMYFSPLDVIVDHEIHVTEGYV